jgi:hypothetical protein
MNVRPTRSLTLAWISLVLTVLGSGGCQWFGPRARPALSVPASAWSTSHFYGTALSGPRGAAIDTPTAWPVRLESAALTTLPTAGFVPLGPMARLVVGSDTPSVLTPSSRVVYSAGFKPSLAADEFDTLIADPTRSVVFAPARGAVAVGTTLRFELANQDQKAGDSRTLVLMLSRRENSDTIEIAIESQDRLNGSSTDVVRELVLIDRQLESQSPVRLAFVLPFAFADSKARGVLAVIEIDPSETPGAATLEEMTTQLASSVADVQSRSVLKAGDEPDLLLARAIDSIGTSSQTWRGSLQLVADLTRADLTRTVLGVADDAVVELIGAQVQSKLPNLASRDARSVAWLLDRSTVSALVSVKEDDAARLLTPIQGALSIYAGEAGRQFDVLHSLTGEAASSEDLFNRIIAEHFILLEESSPARRVRAYDWLAARGKAPEGYDPLGEAKDRRAALDRARAEPTTVPTTSLQTSTR